MFNDLIFILQILLLITSVGYVIEKGKGLQKLFAIIPLIFYFTIATIIGLIDKNYLNAYILNSVFNIFLEIGLITTTLFISYQIVKRFNRGRSESKN